MQEKDGILFVHMSTIVELISDPKPVKEESLDSVVHFRQALIQ